MKLSLFFCKTFIFFHLPSLSPVEGTKVQVLTRTCYELNLYITWTLSQQLLHSQLKAFFFFAPWPQRSERMHPWHDAQLYIPGRTTVRHVEIPLLWLIWIPVQGLTEAAWRYWHTPELEHTYTLSENSGNARCTDVPACNRQIFARKYRPVFRPPLFAIKCIPWLNFLIVLLYQVCFAWTDTQPQSRCVVHMRMQVSVPNSAAQHKTGPLGKYWPLL